MTLGAAASSLEEARVEIEVTSSSIIASFRGALLSPLTAFTMLRLLRLGLQELLNTVEVGALSGSPALLSLLLSASTDERGIGSEVGFGLVASFDL